MFADILGDLCGNVCMVFAGIAFMLVMVIRGVAGSKAVQEGAKLGFWWWLTSDD